MTTIAISQAIPRVAELSLIRDFEARVDGEPVIVAPASQRVVTFLAFQPKPVRRGYLSGALWLDADEQHASASLRTALWRIHPLGLVCASNTHLWLDPDVQVDLRRVISDATAVLSGTPPEAFLLSVAQELLDVGDDILAGWYDDWVIAERERFRQIRLQALDQAGERLLDCGRWFDALQIGLAATAAEPLRESGHRLLVRIHLQQGNVSEAIRQYRAYAQLLREELDGQPSPVITEMITPYLSPSDSTHF